MMLGETLTGVGLVGGERGWVWLIYMYVLSHPGFRACHIKSRYEVYRYYFIPVHGTGIWIVSKTRALDPWFFPPKPAEPGLPR